MRDIRFFLRDMDPTSTGGQLIVTDHGFIDMGKAVGSEGDVATCPACKSTGRVFNNCFPDFGQDGRQALVSGARVYCGCTEKPLVIETQHDSWVEICDARSLAPASVQDCQSDSDDEVIEQYFEVVNTRSGERVTGLRYDLYIDGEMVFRDQLMDNGCTQAVAGQCYLEAVIWHEGRQA